MNEGAGFHLRRFVLERVLPGIPWQVPFCLLTDWWFWDWQWWAMFAGVIVTGALTRAKAHRDLRR